MKDAGYAKGSDGIYAKGGKKLELELVFPSDFADWSSAATTPPSRSRSSASR